MSEIMDLYKEDAGRAIDRLVDGELTDDDTRAILSAMDRDPDGWRRCALAFVESQAIGRDVRGITAESLNSRANVVTPVPLRDVSRKWSWSTGLALAASLLITFGFGLFCGNDVQFWNPPTGVPGKSPLLVNSLPAPTGKASVERWRTMKLNVHDPSSSKPQQIEVPVREMARIDPNWAASDESAISADVIKALEQSGHVVTRERRLWPIELEDGRRVIVPVEQVEVQEAVYQ